jgi:hypothetical protein
VRMMTIDSENMGACYDSKVRCLYITAQDALNSKLFHLLIGQIRLLNQTFGGVD